MQFSEEKSQQRNSHLKNMHFPLGHYIITKHHSYYSGVVMYHKLIMKFMNRNNIWEWKSTVINIVMYQRHYI